jgi:hypothetical protein
VLAGLYVRRAGPAEALAAAVAGVVAVGGAMLAGAGTLPWWLTPAMVGLLAAVGTFAVCLRLQHRGR